MRDPRIHETACVEPTATIGDGTSVWHHAHVREGARIGRECILGKGVYVDRDVVIGDRCKVQNGASLFHGVTLEDGVFVGPHAVFANDRFPRAVTPDGVLKTDADWTEEPTLVRHGASIGASAVVLPGLTIGAWAMIAAGAVVTASVPAHAIVRGNPARITGWACACGRPLRPTGTHMYECDTCARPYHLADLA
ncbi:MAG: N-acetyltransferase [Chloroflexi bacterium]|nr:N-acetyltransferase [Chloroflexota bacterium]